MTAWIVFSWGVTVTEKKNKINILFSDQVSAFLQISFIGWSLVIHFFSLFFLILPCTWTPFERSLVMMHHQTSIWRTGWGKCPKVHLCIYFKGNDYHPPHMISECRWACHPQVAIFICFIGPATNKSYSIIFLPNANEWFSTEYHFHAIIHNSWPLIFSWL